MLWTEQSPECPGLLRIFPSAFSDPQKIPIYCNTAILSVFSAIMPTQFLNNSSRSYETWLRKIAGHPRPCFVACNRRWWFVIWLTGSILIFFSLKMNNSQHSPVCVKRLQERNLHGKFFQSTIIENKLISSSKEQENNPAEVMIIERFIFLRPKLFTY